MSRLVPVALALIVSLVACGGDSTDADDTTAETTAPTTTSAGSEPETTASNDSASEDSASEDSASEDSASEDTASQDNASNESTELFPDVLEATADQGGDGTWTFAATLSSPYDSPERYADAWRVVGPDGTVYGIRELAHDHANEQPFTRSQSGIEIPDDVEIVTVEGRDQISGWGGETVDVSLR
ncbi:MAG: hypothetical protein ACR2QO_25755 [Acidimicrobiales bacterium]